jgi:hypothetical protein
VRSAPRGFKNVQDYKARPLARPAPWLLACARRAFCRERQSLEGIARRHIQPSGVPLRHAWVQRFYQQQRDGSAGLARRLNLCYPSTAGIGRAEAAHRTVGECHATRCPGTLGDR